MDMKAYLTILSDSGHPIVAGKRLALHTRYREFVPTTPISRGWIHVWVGPSAVVVMQPGWCEGGGGREARVGGSPFGGSCREGGHKL